MTQGYQITFFTHQDRRHKGKLISDWMMQLVQELGLRGASVHAGGESFARDVQGEMILWDMSTLQQ